MLAFLQTQADKLLTAGGLLWSVSAVMSVPQLAVAGVMALVFLGVRQYRRRKRVRLGAIGRALYQSRRILFSRSTFADFFYYLVNTFAIGGLVGWGIISGYAVSTHVVQGLDWLFGARAPVAAPALVLRAGITVVAFLGYEFGYYVDHYLKHKIALLWAFHKTHHAAEVLTPLTVFRVHPVDTLVFVDVVALFAGGAHGLFTYATGQQSALFLVGGSNIFTVAFLFLLAHLQHSQFWMPLRGLAGRIFLSPAHHQIHHSIDPQHYNCNFGSALAIFDWMFGTLNMPQAQSARLRFGVSQAAADPHRISSLLLTPFSEALSGVAQASRKRAQATEP